MDIAVELFQKLASDCGLVSMLLFGGMVYQTVQLGRVRAQREDDHKQIVEDAIARTKTAEAHSAAQQQIALALAGRLVPAQ